MSVVAAAPAAALAIGLESVPVSVAAEVTLWKTFAGETGHGMTTRIPTRQKGL